MNSQDIGFIQYEIYNSTGTLLNKLPNFFEQGINLQHSYSVPLVNLGLKPSRDSITLFIYLHFFAQDTLTGFSQETINQTTVRIGFFNLSATVSFENTTLTRFDDSVNLTLSIFEKDITHFPIRNLPVEFWIENESHSSFLNSTYITNDAGKFDIQANTKEIFPGIYFIRVQSFGSVFFNDLNYFNSFCIYPGELTAIVNIDNTTIPVSIPKENLTDSNYLYIRFFHSSCSFSPHDFHLNWTLLDDSGNFLNLENATYYVQFPPITKLGQYPLVVKGTSQFYEDFSLNMTINVIRRYLNVNMDFDSKSQIVSFQFFDNKTGIPISLSSIGRVKVYQIIEPNRTILMELKSAGDSLKIIPLPNPQNRT